MNFPSIEKNYSPIPIQMSEKTIAINNPHEKGAATYITSKTIQLSNWSDKSKCSTICNGQLNLPPGNQFFLTCHNNTSKPAISFSLRPKFSQNHHKIDVSNNVSSCSNAGNQMTSVNFQFQQKSPHRSQTINARKAGNVYTSDVQISFCSSKAKKLHHDSIVPYNFPPQNSHNAPAMTSSLIPSSYSAKHGIFSSSVNSGLKNQTNTDVSLDFGGDETNLKGVLKPLISVKRHVEKSATESTHSQSHVQAVIHHQKLRIEVLRKVMLKEAQVLHQLLNDVKELENKLRSSYAKVSDMKKLTMDIHVLKN